MNQKTVEYEDGKLNWLYLMLLQRKYFCLRIIQSEVCTATGFILAVCLCLGLSRSTLVHQELQFLDSSADLHLSNKKRNHSYHILTICSQDIPCCLKDVFKFSFQFTSGSAAVIRMQVNYLSKLYYHINS